MQFLFPGFLWALLALAVPIILHLFYFRRYKKVYFSNVRFLREVKEETSARNKLRNLLILLMRCLAIALLVFAFAQPFIPISEDTYQGRKNVSVFVDNSFSMQSFGQDLPLLDRAKQRAREILDAYGEATKFQVLTHDLSAAQQRFIGREEALAQIEEIDITAKVVPLSRVLSRQARLFQTDPDALGISYLVSDFQKSISDLQIEDSTVQINVIPIQSVQEKNATIDTAWFDVPAQVLNQTSQLVIQLTNYSEDDLENIKLTTIVNGQEKPLGSVDIPAGETVVDTANITILKTGWHEVIVRITDFPVQFDDTYYLTFYVDEDVRILSMNGNGANARLEAAFANNPYFELVNQDVSRINFSELRGYDLIVLNEVEDITSGLTEELFNYATGGGNVLFFPAEDRPTGSYQNFLARHDANTFETYEESERLVGYVNLDEFLFRDVYQGNQRNVRLPVTKGNYVQSGIQGRGAEKILGYRDGSTFLAKYRVGRGTLLVCSAPLDEDISDLSKNAEIFIPLLYKAAISTGQQSAAAYTIGRDQLIEIQSVENDGDRVVRFSGAVEFIPAMTPLGAKTLLDPGDQVQQAGFYNLLSEDQQIGVYAFNYDRNESDLSYYTPQELRSSYGTQLSIWEPTARASFTDLISEKERGIILWRWCIILALAFLALEILLIRLWKS